MDSNSVYDYQIEKERLSKDGRTFYTEKIKPCNKPPCSIIKSIKEWFYKLLN